MARVTAVSLRGAARAAMLSAGGRGFMRFLALAGPLLATDANRRCDDEAERERLLEAFVRAGFDCLVQDDLLCLTPKDTLLTAIDCAGCTEIDWNSPLHPAQALGMRWLQKEKRPLTSAGRQLIVETLRLGWQPPEKLLGALTELSARAAVMQRRGDESGLHEAGAALLERCNEIRGGHAHEA